MAWRIDENILRGEIDNRVRGRVTGRIWLAGAADPLLLDLRGDCHADLAGCHLTFENPAPIPLTTRPPAQQQRGSAGDITAARKVRVFDIPMPEAYLMLKRGEKVAEHMANCLYLEWYSDSSGRVVVESTDFRLEVSEPTWTFTTEEIAEKKRRAAETAEEAPFVTEIRSDGTEQEWDEFRCEQLLRESDALGERYRRALEKYMDHPDSDRLIAREMGWAWIEEALDEKEAGGDGDEDESSDDDEISAELPEPEPPDPQREGIDWVRDAEGRIAHPIEKRASDALYALLDEIGFRGESAVREDEAMGDFVGHFMNVVAKLAGALGSIASGWEVSDYGLTIAKLKRILEILNESLTAAEALKGGPFLAADRIEHYCAELFGIREDILTLITRLRGS
jgi:hypothetical protein